MDALDCIRCGRLDEADRHIGRARELAPGFFEVRRIEALLRVEEANYVAARDCYEAALDLEPRHAPLRLFFAKFLLRHLSDEDGALGQLREALKLDPGATELLLEAARVNLYLSNFEEARRALDGLMERENAATPWERRKLLDLDLQYHSRLAERELAEHDAAGALTHLKRLRASYERIPEASRDEKTAKTVSKVLPTAASCHSRLEGTLRAAALEFWEWLAETAGRPRLPASEGTLSGTVVRLLGSYGFLTTDDGAELYFAAPLDRPVEVGDRVTFALGSNSVGPCAQNVQRSVQGMPRSPQT